MPRLRKQTPPLKTRRSTDTRTRARAESSGSEDGQALVEFALVLPVVVVILFGIVLFGFALNDSIDQTQLVSEAARFAAVNSEHGTGAIKEPSNPKDFLDWITKQGDNSDVEKATATLCSPESKVGQYVEVKLKSMYNWFKASKVFELFGGTFNAETPIVSTARMRIEVPPSTPYPTTC
jgi:hypothetical protein